MANSPWSFFNQWAVVPDGRYTTAFVSHRLQGHLGCFQRQVITSKATRSALICPCVCLCTCICAHIYMEASDNFRCHSSGLLLLVFLPFCPCFWHFISQWPGASQGDEACQPVIYLPVSIYPVMTLAWATTHPALLCEFWESNSGPHAYEGVVYQLGCLLSPHSECWCIVFVCEYYSE